MNLQPTGKKVLVEIPEQSKEKKGSLILPDEEEKDIITGNIIGIGGEVKEVKIGDEIIFSRRATIDLEHDKTLKVIVEENVLLIIKK